MAQPLIPISYRKAIIFACFLVLYEFLTYIANDMIMPGMLNVIHSFNSTENNVATSLTLYVLGGASLQLILGPVSDAYGRRPLMILGAGLFLLFTLFIASSNSMAQFLTARFFQGMGLCFIGVIGYATIQEIFAEMDAIRIIAIMANAAILAPLLGPVLGALVIHYAGWRWIYIIIACFSAIALWGLWKYMPEPIGQTKTDGSVIAKAPLSFSNTFKNFKQLLCNSSFVFSALSLGLVVIPCMIWIALGPIILIAQAKLTVIQYALWQIPVFTATIVGNWALHRLTYRLQIKPILFIGTFIMIFGLSLTALLPFILGDSYINLMPGIIIYFFSIGIVSAPLNRFALFVTSVTKGTASAIISLFIMVINAISIEIGSAIYKTHVNLYLGLYDFAVGLIIVLFLTLAFVFSKVDVSNQEEDSVSLG